MNCAASLSRQSDSRSAAVEAAEQIVSRLSNGSPDLTCVFISHDHVDSLDEIVAILTEKLGSRVTVGCTGETIIGGGEEIESGPALSVWCASLPGTELIPFRATLEETPEGWVCIGLPEIDDELKSKASSLLLLGEPFSFDPRVIIERLAEELPELPIVGGMASGGGNAGDNRLVLAVRDAGANPEIVVSDGAVGVILCGGSQLRTVVSQGCKPIGKPFIVTKAERNVVYELGGKPPLAQLQEFFGDLSAGDQALVRKGLHLGMAMSEYRDQFGLGDFLISNVIGVDPEKGFLAIGNMVRVGQTVQFHVRDADTADAELRDMLERERDARDASPQGMLLFSCNGRGTRLFPEPNHDAAALQSILGEIPVAGFFAQGELGPVAGKNYVHGYTASVAIF